MPCAAPRCAAWSSRPTSRRRHLASTSAWARAAPWRRAGGRPPRARRTRPKAVARFLFPTSPSASRTSCSSQPVARPGLTTTNCCTCPTGTLLCRAAGPQSQDPHGVTLALTTSTTSPTSTTPSLHAFGDQVLRAVAMRLVEVRPVRRDGARRGRHSALGVQSRSTPRPSPLPSTSSSSCPASARIRHHRPGAARRVTGSRPLSCCSTRKCPPNAKQKRTVAPRSADAMGTDARERFNCSGPAHEL